MQILTLCLKNHLLTSVWHNLLLWNLIIITDKEGLKEILGKGEICHFIKLLVFKQLNLLIHLISSESFNQAATIVSTSLI